MCMCLVHTLSYRCSHLIVLICPFITGEAGVQVMEVCR